jgi:hypothetical protein
MIRIVGIMLFCVLASVTYGILHDQITVRICIEYFTLGHPPVFDTTDPTLLGLGWGIIATWWVGVFLGVPLGLVSTVGSHPQRSLRSLVRPIVGLFGVMATAAAGAGLIAWLLGRNGLISLSGPVAEALPPDRHLPFLVDWWIHSTSYYVGTVGGILVIFWVGWSRSQLARKAKEV